MPYVNVYLTEGFSAETKRQLLQGASDAVVESLGAPVSATRVMLHELPAAHYLNAGQFGTAGLMFQVELIAGRTDEKKAALIAQLCKMGSQVTGITFEEVRARLQDYPTSDMGMAGGVTAKSQRG